MTRFMLAAGVAAMAISVPAASKPGGNGGGHGPGGAAGQHGGGGGHAPQAQRGGGGGGHAQAPHGNGHVAQARPQMQRQAPVRQAQARPQMRHQAPVRQAQFQHQDKQVRQAQAQQMQRVEQARGRQAQAMRQANNDRAQRIRSLNQQQVQRMAANDRAQAVRDFASRQNVQRNFADNVGYGVGGCPPGLRDKGCMPPGQAKKLLGARVADARRVSAWNEVPVRLQSVYADTPDYYYRYGDGYVYRVNRTNDVISSLLPLFGAGYGVGQVFPQTYSTYGLPAAYQPFYPTAPGYDYRYANGYVYQVDPYTGTIQNVDPMLGYGYGYGQMLPPTYSAYNVPYQYRPYYYDTSDYNYRYAPGAIYQVDPQSSLITGVAALLGPGMTIGQQMPLGYSAYNVPYDYRAQYYDTPDNWYRYANGNIYRVDPATQLVTALITSILT